MGDVSRRMTTRTWQRPMRPDSERRDPEGGETDRHDGSATDGHRRALSLTDGIWTLSIMIDANSRAFLLDATPAPRPSPEEENPTFARLRAHGMADGDGQDSSSWRTMQERGRKSQRSGEEQLRLVPNRDTAETEGAKSHRATWQWPRWTSHSSERRIPESTDPWEGLSEAGDSKEPMNKWEVLLSDGRDWSASRSRSRVTPSSSGSGTERPSSRGRGVAGQPGTADPGSRSGSCGTYDGGLSRHRGHVRSQGARSSSRSKRSAWSSAGDGTSHRAHRRRTVAVRSGQPGDESVTTLKEALRDPKRMVRGEIYEAGGHRLLAANTLWTAMSSEAWRKAMALGTADPGRYYCKPERWILLPSGWRCWSPPR